MPLGRRMGRPGLIGMAARTAVVAGTAQATAGAVSHRQQNRYSQQQADAEAQAAPAPAPAPPPAPAPAAAPAPAPAGTDDLIAQLQQLAQLQASGVLTPDEFAAAKAKLLA
jgi:hypothetical protein